MNLSDIYADGGFAALRRLAVEVGATPVYLYQCSKGMRFPSPAMAWRLIEADPRLTLEDLYAAARPASASRAAA